MLLALPLPAVPAVVEPALELGLLELGLLEVALPELGLVLLVPAAPLDVVDELEADRALVSMNSLPERAVLDAAPAVPLVPVAPDAPPPPCRQPVTVTVRLELELGV